MDLQLHLLVSLTKYQILKNQINMCKNTKNFKKLIQDFILMIKILYLFTHRTITKML